MILSVPSYVVPGTYAENLRWIEANTAVRNVELLFFIYDAETADILSRELSELKEYGKRFRFTAHLPDILAPGNGPLLETLAGFVHSFITHPPPPGGDPAEFVRMIDGWRESYGADRFLLENTRLSWFEQADEAFSSSRFGPPPLCADLGHLVLEGVDPSAWVALHAARISELHVHGVVGGRDHSRLDGSEEWFRRMEPFFRSFEGIAQIELFSWADLQPALEALGRFSGNECSLNNTDTTKGNLDV